jgi:hypothetical protein
VVEEAAVSERREMALLAGPLAVRDLMRVETIEVLSEGVAEKRPRLAVVIAEAKMEESEKAPASLEVRERVPRAEVGTKSAAAVGMAGEVELTPTRTDEPTRLSAESVVTEPEKLRVEAVMDCLTVNVLAEVAMRFAEEMAPKVAVVSAPPKVAVPVRPARESVPREEAESVPETSMRGSESEPMAELTVRLATLAVPLPPLPLAVNEDLAVVPARAMELTEPVPARAAVLPLTVGAAEEKRPMVAAPGPERV